MPHDALTATVRRFATALGHPRHRRPYRRLASPRSSRRQTRHRVDESGWAGGSVWELDDRFTGYDTPPFRCGGLQQREDALPHRLGRPRYRTTFETCSHAVTALPDRSLMARGKPLLARRTTGGTVAISQEADDLVQTMVVASGIGATSASTWLTLPVVDDIDRVMAATTLPTLLLGGDPGSDPDATYEGWRRALRILHVRGLVVGRALLHPKDGDVTTVFKRAARLLEGGRHR